MATTNPEKIKIDDSMRTAANATTMESQEKEMNAEQYITEEQSTLDTDSDVLMESDMCVKDEPLLLTMDNPNSYNLKSAMEVTAIDMETEGTKGAAKEEVIPFAQSIAEKMQIARNVVIQCKRTKSATDGMSNGYVDYTLKYTGVCRETIQIAERKLKTSKTFKDWLREKKALEKHSVRFPDGSLRELMLEIYTRELRVPTMQTLITHYLDKSKEKKEERNKILNKNRWKASFLLHGVTWQRLPGTNKSIIVDKTEVSLKSLEYLTRIKMYRAAGRTIVYINAAFNNYQLVVSPRYGVIHACDRKIKRGLENDRMVHTLQEILPPHSVVVMVAFESKLKVPTPFSTKTQMISWLTYHNVRHDANQHRAELYALIKRFKSLDTNHSVLPAKVKSADYDILYRPKSLKGLDFLEVLNPDGTKLGYDETVPRIKSMTIKELQDYEKILINREEEMYQDEIRLEAIVDKLLTLGKYGELTDEDLKECDNEDVENENYYSSIIID